MQLSLDTVQRAARLLREADLYEICLEDENASGTPQRVLLRRDKAIAMPAPTPLPVSSVPAVSTQETPSAAAEETGETLVTSTAVGLYRQPKEPLKVGDAVKTNQVIGVVESMKVPHEIHAPHDGIVKSIPLENGVGVEYGQVLLTLSSS